MLWQILNIETKEKTDIKVDNNEEMKVFDFKNIIQLSLENVRIDQIVLYNKDGEVLKDNKLLKDYYFKNQKIYYRIDEKLVKITIDMFQENIDKIIFFLSQSVSVYYLKKLIVEKTNTKAGETILFYGNKVLREDQIISEEILQTLKDNWANYKPLNSPITPNTTLDQTSLNTYSSSPKSINLKLVRRKNHSNSFSFGIDMSFNHLKCLTKIKWNDEAPDFREVNDGMCLICYCTNPKCKIYKEMFIQNLGKNIKSNLFKDMEDLSFCMKQSF